MRPVVSEGVAVVLLALGGVQDRERAAEELGDHGLDEWRRTGRLEIFHYGDNVTRHVGYELYEDAARYDAFSVARSLPTLVYQGIQDDSVSPEMVAEWSREREHVTLRVVNDGHQLAASMDQIWKESQDFLGLGGEVRREKAEVRST